jgi:hypothetical protein
MWTITSFPCNREGEAVPFCVVLALAAVVWGCEASPDRSRARPAYDTFSAKLIQLSADQDGDGRLDQWTYLDGNRPLRGEADTDGDGRIDRWEYFDANAQLVRVGSSSGSDGIEDTWTYVRPRDGTSRIDRSRHRDRAVDRREYFTGDALVRAEEDGNGDGRTDRWERYDGGVLREAAFDTSFAAGRADRRLLYDERGRFVAVEEDAERDGTFVRLTGAAADAARAGVDKR